MNRRNRLVLAFCGVLGCSAEQSGQTSDARPHDTAIRTGLTLSSWNVRGCTDSAVPLISQVITDVAANLVAVQEITLESSLSTLADELGFAYQINPLPTSGTGPQLGVLWRESALQIDPLEILFTEDTDFPRPVLHTVVTLKQNGASFDLWIVHLKAGTDAPDEESRRLAIAKLHSSLPENRPSLILGDFNEAYGDARSEEVFAPFLNDPENYDVLSWPLAQNGTYTFLPAQIMLDHVVVSRELKETANFSLSVPRVDETINDYSSLVSDHLPVVVTMAE